ncbi:uncharacterized protein LOC113234443 [Hyposmocoma kahamanoa]|uniref:uncharacterized protein LOC113234443 n=1 Tax=Hyposmocoma kahamanoa TaxID=1477025 RepID=UPI000E6D5FE9|nr:uncharacterized protein LOC113234443 [Hyposmocoma kahamanoa]
MEAKLRYCQACLCSERNLYPVAKMYTIFQEISLGEMKSSQGGICWECRKILVKFTRFKAQVQTAQKALTMIDTESIDLKCLSNLSYVTITSLQEYTYSQDPLYNEKKEMEVKVETEDVKYSDDDCEDNVFIDAKPVENVQGIYAEILDTKAKDSVLNVKVRKTVKRKKKSMKLDKGVDIEEDVMKKFTAVVLTEEDMVKYR